MEASDDLSGVDKIYVCGNSFSKLNNGTLDIRLNDYADNYEQITIQATDRAGNKSRMTQLNNPYYEEPKKDSDKTSSSPTSPSIPEMCIRDRPTQCFCASACLRPAPWRKAS